MMERIDIRAGAQACPLTHEEARRLHERLGETYVNPTPTGEEEEAAFALAWALQLALEGGHRQPIELGLAHVVPVVRALQGEELSASLTSLRNALLRLRLEAP